MVMVVWQSLFLVLFLVLFWFCFGARLTRLPGEPQRSLVLQKMLRNEHVRNTIDSQFPVEFTVQQGLKDNAFLLKGVCDEVSKMTPGYSGTPHMARDTRVTHVTPHTSHLTRHTSHLTRHTSHLTPHTSHLTPHTSHLKPHTSHLTPHTPHLTPPCLRSTPSQAAT